MYMYRQVLRPAGRGDSRVKHHVAGPRCCSHRACGRDPTAIQRFQGFCCATEQVLQLSIAALNFLSGGRVALVAAGRFWRQPVHVFTDLPRCMRCILSIMLEWLPFWVRGPPGGGGGKRLAEEPARGLVGGHGGAQQRPGLLWQAHGSAARALPGAAPRLAGSHLYRLPEKLIRGALRSNWIALGTHGGAQRRVPVAGAHQRGTGPLCSWGTLDKITPVLAGREARRRPVG